MLDQSQMMKLQEEYLRKASQLHAEFEVRLKAAQSMGIPEMVQQISAEYQKANLDLVEWMKEQTAAITQAIVTPEAATVRDEDMNIYSADHCEMNLNVVAYRGDRDQMREFLQDGHFAQILSEANDLIQEDQAQKRLLSRSLRLSPQMAPALFFNLDRIKDALGLKVKVEVFAIQDQFFNAGCYPIKDGRVSIFVTSGLLEKFTDEEIAFVLGHELAHGIMEHMRIPVGIILRSGSMGLSPVQTIRLCAWERNAEISADRVGLLCTRNFDAAASAFFKLSSGIASDKYQFNIQDYMKQFADLEKHIQESHVDLEDMYSSHPFNPIRIKALELFHKSDLFQKLTNTGVGELRMAQVEKDISGITRLMEPTYLREQSDVAKTIREFIFYCGYVIARSDGSIQESELAQLGSFLEPGMLETCVAQVQGLTEDEIVKFILARAEKLNLHLPVVTKLNVVRDLSTIVFADGKVDPEEMRIMHNVCNTLGIHPHFADELIPPQAAA